MNDGGPYRQNKLAVDGQEVLLARRSPLLYIALGLSVVVDVAAFVVLVRSPNRGDGGVVTALTWAYGLLLWFGLGAVAIQVRGHLRERKRIGTLVRRSNLGAPQGALGLFEGTIVEGEEGTFTSHLSEKPSVFSEFAVQEYVRSGNASIWTPAGLRSARVSFYLDDDTGAPLLVDPTDAEIVLGHVDGSQVITPALEAVLDDIGINTQIVVRDAVRYRWFERTLSPGERISIVGRVRESPRRLEIEPGFPLVGERVQALAALGGGSTEKALIATLVPFGIVALVVGVIGALLSLRP